MVKKYIHDSRKSVFFFCVIFMLYSLIYMTKNCYSAAMASIVAEGIMTKSQTGTIAAAFYLFYAPFQIIGGLAADRFSPQKLFLFGTIGAAVCNFLVYFFSGNYVAMLIIWSINAIVQFGVYPSVFKIAAAELHPEHRARAVFFIAFPTTVGLTFSYICSAFVSDWKNNFLISGIVLAVSAVVFVFSYRYVKPSMVVSEVQTPLQPQKTSPTAKDLLRIIIKAGIPLLLIVKTISSALDLGVKVLVPVMLTETYTGITPTTANILNILLVIVAPLGNMLAGLRFWKKFSETGAITLLLAVCIPLLIVLTCVGSIPMFFIMTALILLMITLATCTIFFVYISRTFERLGYSGTLSGLINCMASLGIVFSNYVFTRLAEQFGWNFTTLVWLSVGVLSVILALCAVPLWKRFLKTLPQK